jgi:uncharacterized linocin/CFP29 family protein
LGTLEIEEKSSEGKLPYGLRKLQPLLEVRSPFKLSQMELDSITRGNPDPDLDPVAEASRSIAVFEESAVYKGLRSAAIQGLEKTSEHASIKLALDSKKFDAAVSKGIEILQLSGVDGAYSLVLGTNPYQFLKREMLQGGYTLHKSVSKKIRGKVLWSPALKGGLLLSIRGGDRRLTVGQDLSIGYAGHDRDEVELYLVESFSFITMEPKAHTVFTL